VSPDQRLGGGRYIAYAAFHCSLPLFKAGWDGIENLAGNKRTTLFACAPQRSRENCLAFRATLVGGRNASLHEVIRKLIQLGGRRYYRVWGSPPFDSATLLPSYV
jgi:hypothetical protein